MDKNKVAGHLAAAAAYIIFGFNIVLCKNIANSGTISPIVLFTLRALAATILFWGLSLCLPREKVDRRDLPKIFIAAFTGLFVPQFTFLAAISMTTSIDSAILGSLTPIFTMLFAAVFLKEPITSRKAAGVALSFAGMMLLIFNSVNAHNGVDRTHPAGILLMLLNGLSFAAYLGIFRPLISRYNVVTFMKWMFLSALVISLPFSAKGLIETSYSAISAPVAWEIAYVIFFATFLAYFLIPVGQKRLRPTLVSMYSYLQPMIATVISIATGLDVLNWQKIAAIILIFGGVAMVNRSRAAGDPS